MATLHSITPCFIVDNLQASLDFYQSKLGFEIAYKGGGNGDDDGNGDDFWAFVRRDCVMISFKAIAPEIHPQPNHSRHQWARWDAYIHTSDPDALYQEYVARAVPMHQHLKDTEDGLRAFEVIDNNGYVLCFGRPREESASVREPSRREILDELAKREFSKGDYAKFRMIFTQVSECSAGLEPDSRSGNCKQLLSWTCADRHYVQHSTRIGLRLGGRCQWVLDAVYQTVEWPSQPLRFNSVVLRTTTR